MLVIDPPALILLVQTLLRSLLRLAIQADNTVSTVGSIGENIDMQCVRTVLQNVVSIPAYDDTGPLIRQLEDHIALNVPKEVSSGQSVHNAGNTLRCKGIGEEAAGRRVLTVLFNKLGSKTGLHSNLLNQFLIIEGDTQFLCDLTANASAAAAKFTADSDDFLFHAITSFENG